MDPAPPVNPGDILARLPASFEAAHKAGDLFFFDSSVRTVPGEFPVSPPPSLNLSLARECELSAQPR